MQLTLRLKMNYYSETIFNLVWNLENILKKDPNYSINKDDLQILDKSLKIMNNVFKELKNRNEKRNLD